jgi:peptidoglycan/xylan/chitin deacetylase (PgdA/CDA1 family)
MINICPSDNYNDPGFTATDNYDGDLTHKVVKTQKGNQIIYTVKDSSNNETKVIRNVVRSDNELPILTLLGRSNLNITLGTAYYESGYTVTDNCDKDIISKVKVTNNIDINKLGTYTVKYEVSDSSGNTSTALRTVNIVNHPSPKNSTIYLTFDDGPSMTTPKVLDILKEEGIKATFFVLNRSDSFNYLLVRMINEGHTIGLHGNTHDYYTAYASVDSYFNGISTIENKVLNVTGIDSKIIRFIGGSSNTTSRFNPGIMTVLTAEATSRGYHYFDWNVGSTDTINITSSQIYQNVVSNLGSASTYVVLMHDYEGNSKTINALRDIIKYGKNNGYSFSNITMDTPQIKHRVAN